MFNTINQESWSLKRIKQFSGFNLKPDSTQIFKNKDINNEDYIIRCFTLFPLYTKFKHPSNLAPLSPPLSPFPPSSPLVMYTVTRVFLLNHKSSHSISCLESLNCGPSDFQGYALTINLIFTTLNFLLPVTQIHLVHSNLCPSTSSLVHFYSGHKKHSSNVTTFMKSS